VTARSAAGPASGGSASRKTFPRYFLRRPLGVAAATFLGLVVVACLAAPLIAPYPPDAEDLTSVLSGPSLHHLLGTDQLGEDVLSRLLYGGVISFEGIAEALGVAAAIGVPAGLFSAYYGHAVDAVLARLADLGLAVPAIVVLLMVFALPAGGETAAMVALGFLYAPSVYRVVRGAALPLRDAAYVTNARLSGVSTPKIVWRHLLPGTAGPLAVNLSLTAGVTLVVQTGLNYLGLGVAPPTPSWGGMIGDAQSVLEQQPWLLVPTGLTVGLTILSFALLGDAVRDALAETWALEPAAGGAPHRGHAPAAGAEPAPRPGALLCLRGVSVSATGRRGPALTSDVGFDVMPGEAVGIVGESGSGKTLTALAALGLLPAGVSLTAGRCWFAGEQVPLAGSRRARRRPAIGYVAQDPAVSLDPCFTVGFSIAEVVRTRSRISRRAALARGTELLGSLQISAPEDVARRYPHQLSGGLAQRVQIAMALASEPRLLIADEATTALDVTIQAEILDLLRWLRQDTGMALLLITHDWGVVADSCDRAVVMYAGQVVEQGAVTQLVREPLHPYTRALLLADPQHAVPGRRLVAIPGSVPGPDERARGCRFLPRCDLATAECGAGPVPLAEATPERQTRCLHYQDLVPEAVR
jgi:peptide/nickel transport system permease protein